MLIPGNRCIKAIRTHSHKIAAFEIMQTCSCAKTPMFVATVQFSSCFCGKVRGGEVDLSSLI
jgi:hypothetical protein